MTRKTLMVVRFISRRRIARRCYNGSRSSRSRSSRARGVVQRSELFSAERRRYNKNKRAR